MPADPAPDTPRDSRRRPAWSWLAVAAFSFLLAWSCQPTNGEVTPSDVYQVVDTINAELGALLVMSGAPFEPDPSAPALTPRQPRHVVQKAREVLLKVQTLRALNGLPENPVPAFPLTEAVPADSKDMVDAILRDLYELRKKFNVTEPPAQAPLLRGKTPTNVYANLQRASEVLDALGVPRTMPNDVYRVAVMIVHDLDLIVAARHRPSPPVAAPAPKTLSPADTYRIAFDVLDRLREKTEADSALSVRGGIVTPNRRPGPLTPAHVLDLENNLLAELGAIKATLGITTRTVVPPLIHGKTPSDTFDMLARALALVDAL